MHVFGLLIFRTSVYDRQWVQITYLSWAMPPRIAFAYIQEWKGLQCDWCTAGHLKRWTKTKKKKRKGIRSLASNLWIVCDSSHDEAFNLEYSNVVAMLGSVQTCSGWPSWIWTIPTTGSCNLLSLAISIYNLFIVTVSLSVFLLVMKTTSDHINTCKEIFLVSQSSQAEVKTVR